MKKNNTIIWVILAVVAIFMYSQSGQKSEQSCSVTEKSSFDSVLASDFKNYDALAYPLNSTKDNTIYSSPDIRTGTRKTYVRTATVETTDPIFNFPEDTRLTMFRRQAVQDTPTLLYKNGCARYVSALKGNGTITYNVSYYNGVAIYQYTTTSLTSPIEVGAIVCSNNRLYAYESSTIVEPKLASDKQAAMTYSFMYKTALQWYHTNVAKMYITKNYNCGFAPKMKILDMSFEGNLNDKSGLPHTIYNRNGTYTTDSKEGSQALSLNGYNYVEIANDVYLSKYLTGNMTVSYWLKAYPKDKKTPTPWGMAYSNWQNPICKTFDGEFCIRNTNLTSQGTYYFHGAKQVSGRLYWSMGYTGLTYGTWQHWTFVRDDTKKVVTLYIDGLKKTSASYAPSTSYEAGLDPTVSTYPLFIGNGYAGGLNGSIDAVRIYNFAANASEVVKLYQNQEIITTTSIVTSTSTVTTSNVPTTTLAPTTTSSSNPTTTTLKTCSALGGVAKNATCSNYANLYGVSSSDAQYCCKERSTSTDTKSYTWLYIIGGVFLVFFLFMQNKRP